METRTIEQIKIYVLLLNPMAANFEKTNVVAFALNKNDLTDWYESLKVEPYRENGWHKNFKKGTKLEMYNPIEWSEFSGIQECWMTINELQEYMDKATNSFGFTEIPELINFDIDQLYKIQRL